jgi:hypothetical protein
MIWYSAEYKFRPKLSVHFWSVALQLLQAVRTKKNIIPWLLRQRRMTHHPAISKLCAETALAFSNGDPLLWRYKVRGV